MRNYAMILAGAVVVGCGGATEDVVRTADPGKRGLSVEDFPRVPELADGVYSYEQLRSAGDELFTTVSHVRRHRARASWWLTVRAVSSETQRMIDEIGRITDQPITHVDRLLRSRRPHRRELRVSTHRRVLRPPHLARHPRGERQPTESARTMRHRSSCRPSWSPSRRVLTIGGTEPSRFSFLGRAHTGGDLVVYLPDEKDPVHERGLPQPNLSRHALGLPIRVGRDDRTSPGDGCRHVCPWPRLRGIPAGLGGGTRDLPAGHDPVDDDRRPTTAADTRPTRPWQASISASLPPGACLQSQGERTVRRIYTELDGELRSP